MTAEPCPPAYRTMREAKRAAWNAADRAGVKRAEPYNCRRCGQFHTVEARMSGETAGGGGGR
jgi:hypothetical protein